MPITPLHFGVLAPINHFAPGKVSATSFIFVNVWLDAESIRYAITGYGQISHESHALWFALLLAAIVSVFRWKQSWWLGAFIGGISHIALDMLVHTDMSPLEPLIVGNPFYMGLMEPLSLVLLLLCVWLTAQYVSGIRAKVQKALAAARERIAKLSA